MHDNQTLLADYARDDSEAAFREIVQRYLNLVYSTSLRCVNGDTHLAEDVAQITFTDLARTAHKFSGREMLGGWLHRHTCFVASTVMRGRRRRESRERQVMELNAQQDHSEENLEGVLAILDEAINHLGSAERTAIVLRFFERREFRSVGEALGTNEEAARKRVDRALEKVQSFFRRRGFAISISVLGALCLERAVVAAPVGLAASIANSALVGATAGSGTSLGIVSIMNLTKLKLGVMGATLLAAVTVPLILQQRSKVHLQEEGERLRREVSDYQQTNAQLSAMAAGTPGLPGEQMRELLRLRGEVTRLREDSKELARLRAGTNATGMITWFSQVQKLRKRLEQKPSGSIPEFQLLNEQDWFEGIGKGNTLEEEADYRQALARLRYIAKRKFAVLTMVALNKYMAANANQVPEEPSQLETYFDPPLDAAIFDRYKILVPGKAAGQLVPNEKVMGEKAAVDESFDSYYEVGLDSWSNSGVGFSSSPEAMDNYLNSVRAFKSAHGGYGPASAAELRAYLQQPVPDKWLQALFNTDTADTR